MVSSLSQLQNCRFCFPTPRKRAKTPLKKGVGDVSEAKLSPGLRAWLCSKEIIQGWPGDFPWHQLVSTQHNNSQFTSSSSQEPHSKSSCPNSSPVQLQPSLIPALKQDAVETFLYSTAGEARSPLQNAFPAF